MRRLPHYYQKISKEIGIIRQSSLRKGEIDQTQARLLRESEKILNWLAAKQKMQDQNLFGEEIK